MSICRAISTESKPLDSPAWDLGISMTKRARSDGVTLAYLALTACEAPEARQYLRLAFEAAAGSGAVIPLLWALLAVAMLVAREGEAERAVELYALASRYALVAQSHWFADVAGHRIAVTAATLPAGHVALLQARGQARDRGEAARRASWVGPRRLYR